ncbi:MAG: hypothetical protein UU73_C0006G0019 [Candidatus Daviesbacteria bacterium GW2011_GWA1_41_61]|nr:MAG: hypothetical protein UU44_C0006G0019 [Candidatus Daviesbacteria bacterium GW2011_GWB1_41_15]KKS14559.1 MAG: hypothetical protein UU73_C0006G0019 [Candidatus Daviesbacteria bacterium GW2011_GWA1_41_61]
MPEENINTYIIDTSFILAFLLPDERSGQVEEIFKQYALGKVNFIAPYILPFEVVNSLKQAIPKRISKQSARLLVQAFLKHKIELKKVELEEVFDLSLTKNLSVYDASYLYLAKKHHLKCLSLDKHLQNLS